MKSKETCAHWLTSFISDVFTNINASDYLLFKEVIVNLNTILNNIQLSTHMSWATLFTSNDKCHCMHLNHLDRGKYFR